MTVSSGFFNSVNHDRLYDAEQLSSIFDGVIVDGVYENVGEAFNVTAYPDAYNTVLVGTGRAWFDHTWTLNDSRFSITLDPPNEMLGRIDAIVIDVNKERDTRKNSIIYLKGDEATPDFPPTLIDTENHHQYPIAYITRHAEQNGPIKQSDIEITVGTGACPIVTGVLEAQNLENLMQQLDSEFNEWWEGIKTVLDENVATNLQNQIDEINAKLDSDTALVGLLEKPIAEAFMSGDYGLNVTSYNLTSGLPNTAPIKTAFELQNTVTFLPNGETCYILTGWDWSDALSYPSEMYIDINIADKNGVNKSNKYQIKGVFHTYRQDDEITGIVNDAQIVLVGYSIESYPAEFIYLITYCDFWGNNAHIETKLMTVRISSSGTIAIEYSETNSSESLTSYIPNAKRALGLKFGRAVNSVKVSNESTIVPCYGSCRTITNPNGDKFTYDFCYVSLVNSDMVITEEKLTQFTNVPNTLYQRPVLVYYTIWHYVDNQIIAYFAGSSSGNNSTDYGDRIVINPDDLSAQYVADGASTYPLPSEYSYDVSYGVETYSLSEKNGVSVTKIDTGKPPAIITEKRSPYFLGASNLAESLPEGTFIATSDLNGRLYGSASSGQQLAIGTNGGAAMLKAKKTLSANIDISKTVLWLKGFYVSDEYTGYLMIDGITNYVLTYTSYGQGQSVGPGIAKTVSVVKISKGV